MVVLVVVVVVLVVVVVVDVVVLKIKSVFLPFSSQKIAFSWWSGGYIGNLA